MTLEPRALELVRGYPLKLLCRSYDLERGQILWAGADVRSLDTASLHRRMSATKGHLFVLSVLETDVDHDVWRHHPITGYHPAP